MKTNHYAVCIGRGSAVQDTVKQVALEAQELIEIGFTPQGGICITGDRKEGFLAVQAFYRKPYNPLT